VEKFGVAITMLHPVLLCPLMPINANGTTLRTKESSFLNSNISTLSTHKRDCCYSLSKDFNFSNKVAILSYRWKNIPIPPFKVGLQKIHFLCQNRTRGATNIQFIPKRSDEVAKSIHLKPHIFEFDQSSTSEIFPNLEKNGKMVQSYLQKDHLMNPWKLSLPNQLRTKPVNAR